MMQRRDTGKQCLTGRLLVAGLFVVGPLGIGAGCVRATRGPVVTDIDPVEATPDYWWDKGTPVKIEVGSFDRAFGACQGVLRDKFFEVDRLDARSGVITSSPMLTGQVFEPWRRDNSTLGDVARSTAATYRRTVRFDLVKTPGGRYTLSTRVLVERHSVAGRRLSGVLGFRTFTAIDQTSLQAIDESGEEAPASYWYAVGRDYNLEVRLAEAVVGKMY